MTPPDLPHTEECQPGGSLYMMCTSAIRAGKAGKVSTCTVQFGDEPMFIVCATGSAIAKLENLLNPARLGIWVDVSKGAP